MAKLQDAAVAQITEICDRHVNDKTPLMMILSDIQNEYGYIPLEVQELVSQKTGISVAEIYGVVTFYSFFSLTPKGKYVVGCCVVGYGIALNDTAGCQSRNAHLVNIQVFHLYHPFGQGEVLASLQRNGQRVVLVAQ